MLDRLKVLTSIVVGCAVAFVPAGSVHATVIQSFIVPANDGSTATNGQILEFDSRTGDFVGVVVPIQGVNQIIQGLTRGPDGSLYVLEHASGATGFGGPGDIIRIQPNGTRSVVYQGLTRPGSIVIGSDQAIYVSNRGTSVGTGEVLKIEP